MMVGFVLLPISLSRPGHRGRPGLGMSSEAEHGRDVWRHKSGVSRPCGQILLIRTRHSETDGKPLDFVQSGQGKDKGIEFLKVPKPGKVQTDG